MAKPKLEVGDKVVFGRCKANRDIRADFTIGKIYTIMKSPFGDESKGLIDDCGDYESWILHPDNCYKATKIID